MIIGVVGGEDYCLLHINHHDEAMAWARNKKFIWNDKVSSFQVISVEHSEEQEKQEPHSCDIFQISNFDLAYSFGDRTRCTSGKLVFGPQVQGLG